MQRKIAILSIAISLMSLAGLALPSQPAAAGTLITPYSCNTRPTLRIGASGQCVKTVQYIISSWSKRTGNRIEAMAVDGNFGPITSRNVKVLQGKNGISKVGYVGPNTWAALERESQIGTQKPPVGPTTYSTIQNPQSHAAFPAAAKLRDGRIMTVFRSGKQHSPSTSNLTTLYQTFSSDNGATWTKPTKIALKQAGGTALTQTAVSDPGLMVPTSGPLAGRPILTYFERTTSTASRVVVANDANATSWGVPQELNFGMTSTYTSAPVVQLDNNTFIISGYGGIPGYAIGAKSLRLTWNGSIFTQSNAATIAAVKDGRWMTEPNIIKLRDGRLLALIRTDQNKSQATVYKSYSSDNGATWSAITTAFSGWGNPHVAQLTNGKLVATYRHASGSANPAKYGQLWAVYRTSSDNGASWSSEVRYGANPGHEMAYSTPVEYSANKVIFIWAKEDSGYNSHITTNYVNLS